MKNIVGTFLALLLVNGCCLAQGSLKLQWLDSGRQTSLRGMSVPSNDVIWVSGNNGTVGKSTDAGATWKWMVVAGFEKRDFRDVHAFDSATAIIMAVDNPAYILKTTDGGLSWKTTYEKKQDGMFLDAMDFKNDKEGICIGDPLPTGEGRKAFIVVRTYDGGDSWTTLRNDAWPPAEEEEAIFSASGTNITFLQNPEYEYAFVTGGKVAKLYLIGRPGKRSKIVNTPVYQGIPSSGVFSLATDGQKNFYCIGGDYRQPTSLFDNFFYSENEGLKWYSSSAARPLGFRSCIQRIDENRLITCGTTGVDYSTDGAKKWRGLSTTGFNVCMVVPIKNRFFLQVAMEILLR